MVENGEETSLGDDKDDTGRGDVEISLEDTEVEAEGSVVRSSELSSSRGNK